MIIQNKRGDTIISAVMDTWIMCFGIPSMGFYLCNGGEFVNVKMNKLIKRLGVTVTYSPMQWWFTINCDHHKTDNTDHTDCIDDTDNIDNTDDFDDTKDNTGADVDKDGIRAKYLQMDKSMCFLENTVFVVEVLVWEHIRPEIKEAKVYW